MAGRRVVTLTGAGFAMLLVLALTLTMLPGVAEAHVLELVNVSSSEQHLNEASDLPSISADGRYVAFHTTAALADDDTNSTTDIYVRDRLLGTTERVSVKTDGTEGNNASVDPAISADGRYVVFVSDATNLVSGDTNGVSDVFIHDRTTGTTRRVSVSSAGAEADSACLRPSISADGRYVAFDSTATTLVVGDTNNQGDVFVRDCVEGATERVSIRHDGNQATSMSGYASISGNGRYVAFQSHDAYLVPDDTNDAWDVFVRDRVDATTERMSVDSVGTQADNNSLYPAISADGSFVAFLSVATNLVDDDTNAVMDVFVHDRDSGATERVSVNSTGNQGDGDAYSVAISGDGRYVAFDSSATDLVAGDSNSDLDVFVHDRDTGATTRVSVSTTGAQGNGGSDLPSISGDGRYVAFRSQATNLVPDDTIGWLDIFAATNYPVVTGIDPDSGPGAGGTEVTISGYDFVAVTGADGVTFGGVPATDYTVQSATEITATAPAHAAGTVQVEVTGTGGASEDTAADDYTYLAAAYTSIKGVDRFDTAMKISQAMYPSGLAAGSGVVLAPGWESYQEALCGAPLAAAWNGPVLLSSKTVLYSGVAAELVRLGPDQVFCIGLTPALAAAVQGVLPGATVTSINGTLDNVYHMSYLVAKKLGERVNSTGGDMSSATGIVTIGSNFPDAIGVSPLACYQKWPILLTDYHDNRPMNAHAVQAMNELGITTYVKAGTYTPDPTGITGLSNFSGGDRYYTCANAATWAKTHAGLTFTHTGLTTGDKFPDALAGGPYLALDHGTLLLSPVGGPLPTPIHDILVANAEDVQHFTFIAMIEPVISTVKGLLD